MRVVVTGATGNVGTKVVQRLAADGDMSQVVGVARRRPRVPPSSVPVEPLDVATDDLHEVFARADVVVHLAWLFQPTHRPLVTWRTNALGTERVLDAAAKAGVGAIVHASSVGAYAPGPDDGRPVDESWPTHSQPTAAYGREKAYAERLLDIFELEHPDIRVVRMRPAFTFRRASASSQRRLFAGPFLPARVLDGGRLPVLPYPAGLQFQAIHTDDVAAAYHLAVVGDVHGAFNIASDPVLDGPSLARLLDARPLEVPEVLVRAAVAAGWHAHVVPAEPHLFDLFMRLPLMSTERARTQLGWEPRHDATEALREMLEGMSAGAGEGSAPLAPDSVRGRVDEVLTGVGELP